MRRLLLLTLLFLCSCSPKIVERVVEVPRISTEYVTRHDTISIRDSVFVSQKTSNDTVWLEKFVWKERIRTHFDTLLKCDTITKAVVVEQVIEQPYPFTKKARWFVAGAIVAGSVILAFELIQHTKR